jgi:nicotinamide riboside kinase
VEEYGREFSEKQIGNCSMPLNVSTMSSVTDFTEEQKSPNKEDLIPGCTDYNWCTEDFLHIAAVQNANENAQARLCNRILLCDTDSFATSIWHERYMEKVDGRVMQIFDELRAQSDFSKRHYFLMDSVGMSAFCDDDGGNDHDNDDPGMLIWRIMMMYACILLILSTLQRITTPCLLPAGVEFVQDGSRDGEHLREWFFERFEQELKKSGMSYTVLRGSYDDRERQAITIIDEKMMR